MNDKITGVLIDVIKNEMKEVTIDNTVEELRRILNCDTIDIIAREINGVDVLIVCDDCGLLKKNPIPSIICFKNKEVIAGNVFICDFDGVEDICSLSEYKIKRVLDAHHNVFIYE